jgi:hypothetical protein
MAMRQSRGNGGSGSTDYPRYTTYQEAELREVLKGLDPEGRYPQPDILALKQGKRGAPQRTSLLKSHECSVTFPDGREGTCSYTRGGPTWHIFRFTYQDHIGSTSLPMRYCLDRLENSQKAIEEKAKELAAASFADAVSRERRDYFCRATECGGRKARPERFQMSAKRAKRIAGKYALCLSIGGKLLAVSLLFDSLEAANTAWLEKKEEIGDKRLMVACGNRLDRCWELPRFSPLYKEYDPRIFPSAGGQKDGHEEGEKE